MMPQMGSAMPQMGSGMSQMSSGMPQMSYGGAYSTVQGYTNGYDSGTGAYAGSQGYAAESQPSPEEKRVSRLLTATGVPNDNGRLRWPLGLRVLAAPQADELRDQLDALFQESAIQAASGPVNATLAQETQRAVKRFRGLVLKDKAERFGLALAVYDESERFLTRLERAEQVLQAGLNAPGQSQQTTRALSTSDSSAAGAAEVGLSDNSFEPNVLTVPVGTTVRWTNHGHHRHTVTADDGRWDSKEVPGQGVFTYTFTQPGTFPYHCAVHPQEMRGTVVVK
jgi:plastocyanin